MEYALGISLNYYKNNSILYIYILWIINYLNLNNLVGNSSYLAFAYNNDSNEFEEQASKVEQTESKRKRDDSSWSKRKKLDNSNSNNKSDGSSISSGPNDPGPSNYGSSNSGSSGTNPEAPSEDNNNYTIGELFSLVCVMILSQITFVELAPGYVFLTIVYK